MSGGILERGDIVRGDFVLGGYCPGGYCPGDIVRGDIVRGDIVLEPCYGVSPRHNLKAVVDHDPVFLHIYLPFDRACG